MLVQKNEGLAGLISQSKKISILRQFL